jgi:hypothetical protein
MADERARQCQPAGADLGGGRQDGVLMLARDCRMLGLLLNTEYYELHLHGFEFWVACEYAVDLRGFQLLPKAMALFHLISVQHKLHGGAALLQCSH